MTALARTWLYVPATRPERFEKAAASGADRIIIDLEDAVAPDAKEEARSRLAAAALPSTVQVYVRVNGNDTRWFDEDVAAAARLPIAGVMLPKATAAEQVAALAVALPEQKTIVPLVETAAGLWNVLEVARAPRVERLAFGAVDFQLDVGMAGGAVELAYARSRIAIASRVAGIGAPVDAISEAIDDAAQIEADAREGRRFGFGGKMCIHPRQVTAIHAAYRPSASEIAWARGLLEALAARSGDDRGVFLYRGAMVDRPFIERARQIVAACE
jgi:citrate lyase subunit beta/citryl-CoA lyase